MQKKLPSKFLLSCSLFLAAGTAQAFPENIRYGYNNCQTCHISPTGGGVVSNYGRGTSEAFMSTWSYPGQGDALWGALKSPDWLSVGGDVRQVQYAVQQGDTKFSRNFMMQKELEVSVQPFPGLYLVTSGGSYGENEVWERRRYYMLVNHEYEGGEMSANFRVGRFFPSYGIFLDDHTKIIRRGLGFDQGQETFNTEATFAHSSYGQIAISRVLGNRPSFADDGYGNIDHKANGNDGFTLKASWFYTKTTQFNLSYLDFKNGDNRRRAVGLSSMTGFTKRLYGMFEWDHMKDQPDVVDTDIAFARIGYYIFQGFSVRGDLQMNRSSLIDYKAYGAGVNWLPVPHFELSAYYDATNQNGEAGSVWMTMLHYYL